jgi:hypothetical protein
MKMKFAILAVTLLLVGTAQAGFKSTYVTAVDTAGRTAFGDAMSARSAANPNSYIGCSVLGFSSGSGEAICEAVTATGVRASCFSTNPTIVQAAASGGSSSYYYFQWDTSSQCTYLYVSNSSVFGPMQP